MGKKKSSQSRSHQILGVISAKRAALFLTDLVNLPGDWPMKFENPPKLIPPATFRGGAFGSWAEMETAARAYLVSRPASKVSLPSLPDPMQRFSDAVERLRKKYRDICNDNPIVGHLWLRDFLRLAWDTSDLRAREWYLFRFRDLYHVMARRIDMTPEEIREDEVRAVHASAPRHAPPAVTPIEAALFWFGRNASNARTCPNPECPARYFFAVKKNQRYCSAECALPTQRESKREWWRRNLGKKIGPR